MELKDAGEFGLIEIIRNITSRPEAEKESIGIGDDCAVLPVIGGESLLVSTDTMVEHRHFRRDFSSPRQIGKKLAAVNLSDIAAMGGSPRALFLTLQAPGDIPVEWIREFGAGVHESGQEFGAWIAGGDTVQSGTLAVGLTVVGTVREKPLLRSGACPGDEIWVSGTIGGAGAGLRMLESDVSDPLAELIDRYQTPSPRIELGKKLRELGVVTAMIDVSDGLLQDAGHIASQSHCDVSIILAEVPVPAGVPFEGYSLLDAVAAGDDYELLFSVLPGKTAELREASESAGVPVRRIGRVIEGPGEVLLAVGSEAPRRAAEIVQRVGYEHFRAR